MWSLCSSVLYIFNPSKSKLLCYNLLTNSVPNVKLCCESVVDNENHLGNTFFNNIYKRGMKGLVSDLYKLSNAVIAKRYVIVKHWIVYIQCFVQVCMVLNYLIITINMSDLRLLGVSLGLHIVLIMILLVSWET